MRWFGMGGFAEQSPPHDLAVVIVSHGSSQWLPACLRSVYTAAEGLNLDVVVANNHPSDEVAALLAAEFPHVRVLRCENLGFAHGNNTAYRTTDARYVLFLNPDTKILRGSLERLVADMDANRSWGALGCRQTGDEGELLATMRRFPGVLRVLAEALGSERLGRRSPGLRVLDPRRYDSVTHCDWIVGSFMLLRREAFEYAGRFDERYFLFHEETDLCLRVRRSGWEVVYSPALEIYHQAEKGELDARMTAQHALAHRQYALKQFSRPRALAYLAALGYGYAARGAIAALRPSRSGRRRALRRARRVLIGLDPPPFMPAEAPRGT